MTRARRRRLGRSGRDGAALILTLLVLAIMVVLVVQLTYSVKVEETIVRNTEDDAAMELAGLRGSFPLIAALFRDDKKNGAPAGAIDTQGDIMFDPKTVEQRQFQVGDIAVTLELEDLERRLPLAWLADAQRKDMAEIALRRLIEKVAPIEGDAAAMAKQIGDRVRELEGFAEAAPPAGGGTPAPPPQPTPEGASKPRRFTSLDQLLAAPAAEGGEASPPAEGAPAGGIDRRLLYGDPDADPPKQGIAGFLTTWPVPTVNLNTVLPEVLFALLPEKNKDDQPLWEEADAVVDGIRRFRIDVPLQETSAPADGSGGAPAPGGGGGEQGASRSWSGTAFTKVDELQNEAIHAKLKSIFTKSAPAGGGGGGGGGGTPAATEEFGFKNLLSVESRYYMVRVKARRGDAGGEATVESTYRVMVWRGADDVAHPLFVVEAPAGVLEEAPPR